MTTTTRTKTDSSGFASTSVPRHLVRGAVGFGGLTGALALMPAVGPVSLLLLPVGVLALRGCPVCWAIGLVQTVSRGRLHRSCEDGRCALTVAGDEKRPSVSGRPRSADQDAVGAGAAGRGSPVRLARPRL